MGIQVQSEKGRPKGLIHSSFQQLVVDRKCSCIGVHWIHVWSDCNSFIFFNTNMDNTPEVTSLHN